MKKTKITVGIPALNEEANIVFLLQDVLAQEIKELEIEKVIVSSDGSTDATVEKVLSIKDKRVEILDGKVREGKAARLNQMIEMVESDVLVFLDADTQINDLAFLQKLVKPILEGRADLTSAALVEASPRAFFEEVLDVSMRLKRILFKSFKGGNNLYNCHGPARAFSKSLYKSLNFEESAGDDMYSYLYCIKKGKKFLFVESAKINYRLPSTFSDHCKQSIRYIGSIARYSTLFSRGLVEREFRIPFRVILFAGARALPIVVRYPIHTIFYLIVFWIVKIKSFSKVRLDSTWEVGSSKVLRN